MAAAGARPCRPQRRGAGMRRPEPQRAARASPQPAGAREPRSPRLLSPFSPTEPRHRLPPSSATSACRARACHFLGAPAAGPPASSAAPSPPLKSPPVPKEKRASGEGGDQQPGGVGDPRRRTPGGVWRAGRPGLRRPGADRADPSVGRSAGLSPSAAPVPRGSGGCSDLTAAWIRRGRAL